jgi:AGZA family xanthine/uracil permease-like MFS transporter
MLHPIKYIEWPTLTESIPALITLFSIPITFSIARGIGLGLVSYVVLNLISWKLAKLNITLYILTAIFAVYLFLPT